MTACELVTSPSIDEHKQCAYLQECCQVTPLARGQHLAKGDAGSQAVQVESTFISAAQKFGNFTLHLSNT